MTEGVFNSEPLSLNPKCIIITLLIALAYWFLLGKKEGRNWKNSLLLFVVTTIFFLIYDGMYMCSPTLIYANIAKAMVFALIITLIAYVLPYRSIFVLLLLLYLPYLLNTWYDFFFDCSSKLQPTIFPFGRYVYLPFKPADYQERWRLLPDSKKLEIARYDKFFLLIIIGVIVIFAITKIIEAVKFKAK